MEFPEKISAWLYERAEKKSAYELDLCNILDVKSGIMLAVITIFASDPLHVFSAMPSGICAKAFAVAFGCALFIATVFSIAALWQRDYRSDSLPEKYENWVFRLCEYYEEHAPETGSKEEAVKKHIAQEFFEKLRNRASLNAKLNKSKRQCLLWSFRFVAASIALYIIIDLAFRLA